VKEHELFQRNGDDLVLEMPISFTQATLGAHVEVPTLEALASIVIPRATQHGKVFTISGAGLPNVRTGRRGDIVLVAKIEIPKKLSDEQESLLREFAKTEDDASVLPEHHGFWDRIKRLIG
jgi:molecular chaperone DnaJ